MSDLKKAILMNMKDNVATALFPLKRDESVAIVLDNEVISEINVLDDIERYHKIAIKYIHEGDLVYKYGEVIGRAVNCIKVGKHVHVNNIESVMGK